MTILCPHCGANSVTGAQTCSVCKRPIPASATPALQTAHSTQFSLPATGKAQLVLSDGTAFALQTTSTLGRDHHTCTLFFPQDDQLSRLHAQIEERNGQWIISDLNSRNGTWVNGAQITTPTILQPGAQIRIGTLIFSFQIPGLTIAPRGTQLTPANFSPPPVNLSGQSPYQSSVAWRTWTYEPSVEGYVKHVSDRYTIKKDDLLKRGLTAAALALIISPALAFLPFIQGNDLAARDMRVEDRQRPGRQVAVQILGDMLGSITLGDAIAIWGQVQQGGLVIMQSAYNYTTDSEVRLKK